MATLSGRFPFRPIPLNPVIYFFSMSKNERLLRVDKLVFTCLAGRTA